MDALAYPGCGLKRMEEADPRGETLMKSAQEKMGMVPNMYAAMANFSPLLDAYVHGYELFRSESGFSMMEQEVVFLAISYENNCDYCMAAHSFVADIMSHVPAEITDALRDGRELPDPRLQALSSLAKSLVIKRGNPDGEEIQAFLAAGYTQNQILSLVLAVGIKTLSNYSNHLLKTPLDAAFKGRSWDGPVTET